MHAHHNVPQHEQIDVGTFGCRVTTKAVRNLAHLSSVVNRFNKTSFILNTVLSLRTPILEIGGFQLIVTVEFLTRCYYNWSAEHHVS